MPASRTIATSIAMLVMLGAFAAGCGEDRGSSRAAPRPSRAAKPLSQIRMPDAVLTVGSKDFTEQLVLGHIARLALEATGATVEDQIGSSSTFAARSALLNGEIDLYWDYTGTGWIEFLGHPRPIPDVDEQYESTAREDLAKNDVTWLTPAPLDNTYAIAVRKAVARDLDLVAISDLERVLEEHPDQATICVESEFVSREDGLPGLERHYGFDFPDERVRLLDTGVIYTSIESGRPCTFGEVFATDARVGSLDLVVLRDDKQFFPHYTPAVTIRSSVLARYPKVADVFERIAPRLDQETMIRLNGEVDIDGRLPEEVAEAWLEGEGFID